MSSKAPIIFYTLLGIIILMLWWIFLTPYWTDVCTDRIEICLLEGKKMTFGKSVCKGFSCLFENVACVLSNFLQSAKDGLWKIF